MSEAESLKALDDAALAILTKAKPTEEEYKIFLQRFREHHEKYGSIIEPRLADKNQK